ncbi:MAG: tetratricopeptide repeat protein [Planctomycetota bacterium]
MPTTVNGIGTWYYGKKNCISYDDYCPHCNRYVTLSSYDTREWIVVLFIPVIPFGKKRIMDSCPACRRHKQMSLKKYLKHKDKDYAEAMEKYDANPNDPETVINLLGVFSAYQDLESLEALAQQVTEQFADNSKVQAAIGSIYYNHGNMDQARCYLEKSLLLKSDDAVHEILGFVYLRISEPDQAAGHFQHIIDQRIQEKTGTLFALVDGYQGQGRHQDAIELMDAIVNIDPSIKNDKNYKKTRKLSEKNLHSCKPTKNRHFVRTGGGGIGQTPVNAKKAAGIAAAVLLLAFLVYSAAAFYMGKHADVYLVNGLSRSYEVMLDGQTYTIPRSGYKKINLSEGVKELTVSDENISIASEKIEMHSSFWKRPFMDRVYVINPDTVALLQWAKIFYAETASRVPDPVWRLHVGKTLYVFDGVHLPFEEFPDEISLSGSGPEARVQVSMVDECEVLREQFSSVIEHYIGFEMKIDYLKKSVRYEPDNTNLMYGLYAEADADTFIETIRPGLDAMPIRINWHRMYQTAMDAQHPEYDLQSEYKHRLDKAPESSELRYLYGRTLNEDRQQAKDWFKKATETSNPCAYGYYALGYDAMVTADFKNALSYFEKALEIEPDNPIFCNLYYEMLVAENQLDKACDYCDKQIAQEDNIYMYTWVQEYVRILRQLGRNERADQVFEQWYRQNKNLYAPEDFEALRRSNELSTIYQDGDFDVIRRFIGEPNRIEDQVLLALNSRETIPDELMVQSDSFPSIWMLLFYISESQLANEDNANLFLDRAAEQLKSGGYEQRYAANCLTMEKQIDEQKICCLAMEAPLKAVTLTALGVKFPEHREHFFDLAKRLNYKKVFPYHYLNSVHDGFLEKAVLSTEIKAKQI